MRRTVFGRLIMVVLAAAVLLGACQARRVAGGKDVTLKIMSWHGPDTDSFFYAGYKEAADAYTKLHPNVSFEFIYQPLEGYKELLEAQFAAGNAPDIVHMQQGLIQEFSNKDALLNLDIYMYARSRYSPEKRWVDTFVEGEDGFGAVKALNRYGAITVVPMDSNPALSIGQSFLYNKDLFTKAGLDPEQMPKTWKEFIDICAKLKSAGIVPVAADNDRWIGWSLGMVAYQFGNKYVDQFFDAKYNNVSDRIDFFWDKVYIALALGKLEHVPYMSEVLPLYKQFSTFWQEGWTGTSYAEAQNLFLSQKAAMFAIGFWDMHHYVKVIEDFGWGIFPVPLITKETAPSSNEAYPRPPIQQSFGFVLNRDLESSPQRTAAAVGFLQYFTSRKVQAVYVKTAKSLSPILGVPIPDEMKGFVLPIEKSTSGEIVAYAMIEWGDGAKWPGYTREFIAGKLDAATYLAKCAALSRQTGVDYVQWATSKDGFPSQIGAARKKLEEMRAAGANPGAMLFQEDTVSLMELRLEMFQNYGALLKK